MGYNPSETKVDNLPVVNISFEEVKKFLKKLNEKTNYQFNYRLPTEAEWEFAARGGNKSRNYKYSGSNKLDDVAWYYINSHSQIRPVGLKAPNELGIYDMSGNVWEFCSDYYDGNYYRYAPSNDPKGPMNGQGKVIRGGSYDTSYDGCTVDYRSFINVNQKFDDLGFRIVSEKQPRLN